MPSAPVPTFGCPPLDRIRISKRRRRPLGGDQLTPLWRRVTVGGRRFGSETLPLRRWSAPRLRAFLDAIQRFDHSTNVHDGIDFLDDVRALAWFPADGTAEGRSTRWIEHKGTAGRVLSFPNALVQCFVLCHVFSMTPESATSSDV